MSFTRGTPEERGLLRISNESQLKAEIKEALIIKRMGGRTSLSLRSIKFPIRRVRTKCLLEMSA